MSFPTVNFTIRTLYFKVPDIEAAGAFWQAVLGIGPHKDFESWKEFWCGNIRLGLLLNDFGDDFKGANCVPVFEFKDEDLPAFIDRAKQAGATVCVDGLDKPHMKSILFADPWGNEFEFSKFHD